MNKVAIVLVNYKDYAQRFLTDCLASLRAQEYSGEIKIFIVDNASTEESYNYLKREIPEARIICNINNDGFAKGNNDAIKIALDEGFDYVILFNLDVIVDKYCVNNMVARAVEDETVGIVQARLMLHPEMDKVNSMGNDTHFLGFGYSVGYKDSVINFDFVKLDRREICYPSGAAVLFKAETLRQIGLLDEVFWMYNEDQDIGWRAWLAGWRCVLATQAVVYHKYEFSRSISKYYWMDRNRNLAMLKNYHILTLLLIFPAWIAMELGLIFFAIKGGWFWDKLRVYGFFLNPLNWPYFWRARREVQKMRRWPDKRIVMNFSGIIWYQEIGSPALVLANKILNKYWQKVKKIIVW